MDAKDIITDVQKGQKPQISIFVCCHKPAVVPVHPLLVPLQVGTELTGDRFPGYVYDNTSDNISDKNRYYCELTGAYWAWKNYDADYYGFFHYRRYLYPDENTAKPYMCLGAPSAESLEKLNYDKFSSIISTHDVVAPLAEDMHISVRDHYRYSKGHFIRDLYKIEEIVSRKYPDYISSMDRYLSGTKIYFGNIFVMRKDVFFDYCSWLFDILDSFDAEMANSTGSNTAESNIAGSNIAGSDIAASDIGFRTEGYLGERLLGIYLTKWNDELDVVHLPRVHFMPDAIERMKHKSINAVLPPGSGRRAIVKKLLKSNA